MDTILWLIGKKCPWTSFLHLSVTKLVSVLFFPSLEMMSGRPHVFKDGKHRLLAAASESTRCAEQTSLLTQHVHGKTDVLMYNGALCVSRGRMGG